MELKPITSDRRVRKFSVYDMEWVPGSYKLRVIGLYDGNRYRSFLGISDFLNSILVPRNHGRWFFAHAGGLADVQFVLDELGHNPNYQIDAAFSGASAIIVTVKRGRLRWHFIDSLWLFRNSLDEIAKSLGMEKTGAAKLDTEEERREWYASVALPILRDYNENDCQVLYRAISDFQVAVLEMGGQLQMTIASTSMHLFRRRYLRDVIYTSELVNQKAALSYVASRVEVFCADCIDSRFYDINSSFPHAMTQTIPGSPIKQYAYLRESLLADDVPLLAQATIHVPDTYLPPLPYRHEGRVYFPTGTWSGYFTGPDLRLLLEEGGSILESREMILFEARHDLRDFAEDLYRKRNESDDEFHRYTYKIVLNSNYGKWAEGLEKERLHINPSREVIDRIEKRAAREGVNARSKYMKRPGMWVEPVIRKFVPHRHVIVSSYITARARAALFRYMGQCNEIHYCDTDGFSTDTRLETSKDLGGLKLEKIIDTAKFVAPKVYRIDGMIDGKKQTIVRAKGFSLPKEKDKAVKTFERIAAGETIDITRMSRIKENIRDDDMSPKDRKVPKAILNVQRPKRYTYPSGETRPWTVDEIMIDDAWVPEAQWDEE